jgi:hypothetical protein
MVVCLSLTVFLQEATAQCLTRSQSSKKTCCCSSVIKGNYRFFTQTSYGVISGPHTAEFTTRACAFQSGTTSNGYKIYGTIHGNQASFTMVVDGEEAEGYVMQIEGFTRDNAVLVGVYRDSNGASGSFTASRLP